jgi:NADH dehydrogenase
MPINKQPRKIRANMAKTKVLIVGGGFGGVKAALELAKDSKAEITLLSDQTDFRYYPSLYHTATGGDKRNSSIPLSKLLPKSVNLIQGEAATIDKRGKTLTTTDGKIFTYTYLILSLGVVTNYFGIAGLPEYSYSIKSIPEIKRFKDHLHQQLIDEKQPDLNYVIVGAGPTGIELSGALPEYLRKIMANHGVKHKAIHIDLIEASPRLLPRMPKDTSAMVKRQLKKLGIKLYVGQTVQAETVDELTINGKPIRSHTVVWTAGVTNHPFFKANNFTITPRGKVAVDAYLQADDSIYVIGDNANTPYSGLAQTALHDGISAAKNIIRLIDGKDQRGYKVVKPITVIPAGPHWAAVNWGKLHLYGWMGWTLRESADLIAFHDYEPWWRAGKQWLTEFDEQEDCPICAGKASE